MNKLPIEIVDYILTYDKRFVLRNGKIIVIQPIPKNDKRFALLQKIPPKKYSSHYHPERQPHVYLRINKLKYYYITYRDFTIFICVFINSESSYGSVSFEKNRNFYRIV